MHEDEVTIAVRGDQPGRTFSLDRKRPAAQQVYEDLRRRIITLELRPGASLARPAIADFYTVSQTPVRDAFLKLEQEGLVEIYPQSKTLVARIDVKQARETQFLRTAIELEVAHTLIAADSARAVLRARRILTDQIRAREDDDLEQFTHLDRQFHFVLCEVAGQPVLWDLVLSRSGHIDRLRNLDLPNPGKTNRVLEEHEAIVAALESGNEAAATAAVRKHLSGTLSNVETIMHAYPDYF